MVAHAYSFSSQEVDVGGLQVQGHLVSWKPAWNGFPTTSYQTEAMLADYIPPFPWAPWEVVTVEPITQLPTLACAFPSIRCPSDATKCSLAQVLFALRKPSWVLTVPHNTLSQF